MFARILLLVLTAVFALPTFAEPTNLSRQITELKKYHDDGSYAQEFATAIQQAKEILKIHVELNKSRKEKKNLALVLDIDETSLSNYDDMVKLNFGGTLKSIDENIALGHDAVLKPTLDLYNFAKQQGIAVFFVTGRHDTIKDSTIKNLETAGYHGWKGIYFKPNDYHQPTAVTFKAKARQDIMKKGYEIVESIGDQWSDLAGGFAANTIKLPNPYYFIP